MSFLFCSLFCPLQLILTHSEIAISFWEAGHWPTSSEVRSTDPSRRQQAARREQTVVFDFFACFFELFFFPTSPSLTHSSRSLFLSRPSSPPTCSSPRPAPRSSAEAPSARRQRRCSQAHRQQRGASRRRPFPICRTTTSEFFPFRFRLCLRFLSTTTSTTPFVHLLSTSFPFLSASSTPFSSAKTSGKTPTTTTTTIITTTSTTT